jgi:hypothetical protein
MAQRPQARQTLHTKCREHEWGDDGSSDNSHQQPERSSFDRQMRERATLPNDRVALREPTDAKLPVRSRRYKQGYQQRQDDARHRFNPPGTGARLASAL